MLYLTLFPLVSGAQGHRKQQHGVQSLSSWDSRTGGPPLPLRLALAVSDFLSCPLVLKRGECRPSGTLLSNPFNKARTMTWARPGCRAFKGSHSVGLHSGLTPRSPSPCSVFHQIQRMCLEHMASSLLAHFQLSPQRLPLPGALRTPMLMPCPPPSPPTWRCASIDPEFLR